MNIDLPEEEVVLWQLFLRHREKIEILIKDGVFNLKNGSITIHCQEGNFMEIVQKKVTYKRKR